MPKKKDKAKTLRRKAFLENKLTGRDYTKVKKTKHRPYILKN